MSVESLEFDAGGPTSDDCLVQLRTLHESYLRENQTLNEALKRSRQAVEAQHLPVVHLAHALFLEQQAACLKAGFTVDEMCRVLE